MRKILVFTALLTCVFFACKKAKKESSQPGVYKMDKLTVSSGGKDSVYARTQVKIYTDHHFAYASMAPDSSVGFGIGSYKADTGNNIIETSIYSSASLDSPQTFHIALTQQDSGYTQVLPLTSPKGVKYTVTEAYTRLATDGASKLDGVWKLDEAYIVKGKDTTKQPENQYKAFWGGHFMFVHRYAVDNTNLHFKNGFGYGDYTLRNDTLSESEKITNHATLLGRSFAIKINFNGDDEYSQVITDSTDGSRSVEIYRRLK
ncbi:hypothetical protein [Mucilaginibacter sp.]|jgi:hypothetical protein|uniref:hypothetical protein n=1 Tax=Mucilaginibacter sp. TaxID=1882438 RepID=UPI002B64EE6A|nr:hypothetical protein [Mucilaginibacter sp.]HTI61269.1 hypothetical protein [Mucilaginibacter sp.]